MVTADDGHAGLAHFFREQNRLDRSTRARDHYAHVSGSQRSTAVVQQLGALHRLHRISLLRSAGLPPPELANNDPPMPVKITRPRAFADLFRTRAQRCVLIALVKRQQTAMRCGLRQDVIQHRYPAHAFFLFSHSSTGRSAVGL